MAAAFGARFAAQHFDLLARTGDGNAVPRPQRERSASPTLAELRAAAEAGSPLVREETPDSDVEREKEAEAERLRVEAEEEAARLYREERDRMRRIEEQEERQRKRAEDRARRAREKEEKALRRAAEKLARQQAAERAFEDWKSVAESVTLDDGSRYSGEFRARRKDSDWEEGLPRLICRHGRGIYQFTDGSVYEGDFHNDIMYGNGVAKYADGTTMDGWWEGGMLQKGSLVQPNKGEYGGEFEDSSFHGNGFLRYSNGSSYVGEWERGRRSGKGVYKYANGDEYDGEWKADVYHGEGRLSASAKASVFEGEFARGKRDGQGTQTYPNGAVYVGLWSKGTRHGNGKMTHSDFEYEGAWAHDQKHGQGVLRWQRRVSPVETRTEVDEAGGSDILALTAEESLGAAEVSSEREEDSSEGQYKSHVDTENGLQIEPQSHANGRPDEQSDLVHGDAHEMAFEYQYVGNFQHGHKHGHGELRYPTGETYCGEWEKNVRHGVGILTADSFTYEGEFQLNHYHGSGSYVCLNTFSTYDGLWSKGFQHGQGKVSTKEGSVMEGSFVKGKAHGAAHVKQEFDDETLSCQCNYVQGRRHGAARIESVCTRYDDKCNGDDSGSGNVSSQEEVLIFHAQYDTGELQNIVTFGKVE